MTLQQVKDELEDFFINHKMLTPNCVQNSLMLIWHWGFTPYIVHITGHQVVACPERKMLIDPTVGCIWNTNSFTKDFFIKILKGKRPDEYLSWYIEDGYRFWWDYTFKYEESKHTLGAREEWDVDLKLEIISFLMFRKLFNGMGKFSDYMR